MALSMVTFSHLNYNNRLWMWGTFVQFVVLPKVPGNHFECYCIANVKIQLWKGLAIQNYRENNGRPDNF